MNKLWPLAFFAMATGIILAYYKLGVIAVCMMIILFASTITCVKYRRQLLVGLLLLLVGFVYAQLRIPVMPAALSGVQGVSCSGRIHDFPLIEEDKTTFILLTKRNSPWEKKIRVVCYFKADLARGDYVSLYGVLKTPRRPGNPGEFDYPLYLSHNGIYYNLSVKNSGDLQIAVRNRGALYWLDKFRMRGETLARDNLPAHEAAILLGMILGTREDIDEDQYQAFQKTGIIHLFSVSGLHVGFLLLLVGWIVSLLGLSKGKRFIIGTTVLLLYGTMIAWPICVIRSIFMGILGLGAYYFGRKSDMMNALAIAGIFNLLIAPSALFTISFQLTFLAAWGLIFIFPRLREIFPYKGWGWDLIWLPLAAELAVLPMIAYYFNILTPVSIITNILVAYISGAAVIIGFIALFLTPIIPFLAALFFYPAGFFTEVILFIVNRVQHLPGAYIWVKTPPVLLVILYYVGLVAVISALKNPPQRKWLYPSSAIILLFFVVLLIPASFYNRGMLEVDFIDVGQGDGILIKTPQGKFILLDGGGSTFYDVGNNTVLPYLHRRGIRYLHMIINSHPDNDHLQGLESVTKETPVGLIAVPYNLLNAEEYRPLKQTAQRRKVSWQGLSAGQEIKLEKGLRIQVLHPGGDTFKKNNSNNQSVVLRISYGEFSLLLTGDIEKEAMQALLNEGLLNNTTIVKIPHHGSKGSLVPEFYQQLNARYAVISVGDNNHFGHPSPDILTMLKQANLQILRTDLDGAIIIFTDGRHMQIKKHREH